MVLSAPPSAQKSAAMPTYFLCWSVVGPLIHIMLPAAGPIFYMQMGYGDRFAALQNVSETREIAAYLWAIHAGDGFGPGSGISAMPSLHIATTAWMVLAARAFRPRLFVPTLLLGFAIFLLSIALGWHYAMDGIVGGLAAWLMPSMPVGYGDAQASTLRLRRRGGSPHRTSSERTESTRCGLLRTLANRIEKPAGMAPSGVDDQAGFSR